MVNSGVVHILQKRKSTPALPTHEKPLGEELQG